MTDKQQLQTIQVDRPVGVVGVFMLLLAWAIIDLERWLVGYEEQVESGQA